MNAAFLAKTFLVVVSIALAAAPAVTVATGKQAAALHGDVQSAGNGLAGYRVSLYASFVDHGPSWRLLGSDTSDSAGKFQITYSLPPDLRTIADSVRAGGARAGDAGERDRHGIHSARERRRQRTHHGRHRERVCAVRRRSQDRRQHLRDDQRPSHGGQPRRPANGSGRGRARFDRRTGRRHRPTRRSTRSATWSRVASPTPTTASTLRSSPAARRPRADQRGSGAREHREKSVLPRISGQRERSGVPAVAGATRSISPRSRKGRRIGCCS